MTQSIVERTTTEQLLHGEPHPGNLLRTKKGLLFGDLETACQGPIEFDVAHAPRQGPSRYSPLRLTRMALHVLAGFWPQPIQWIGVALGVLCSLVALALAAYGIVFWIDESNFPGPLFGGVAVLFVLGIQGFILALIGEYLGRIQRDVEGRPLYVVNREF